MMNGQMDIVTTSLLELLIAAKNVSILGQARNL